MSKTSSVILISGSPSAVSRSASLLERLAALLRAQGQSARVVYATDFPASELIHGNIDAKSVSEFRQQVADASAVVFATPIYKGTYSGLLKLLIDFIPPDGLEGKTVLAFATGRLDAHFPLVSEAFETLTGVFRGAQPLPTVIISDYQFLANGGLEASAEAAFQRATDLLTGPGLVSAAASA